jgi:hypothetical protein
MADIMPEEVEVGCFKYLLLLPLRGGLEGEELEVVTLLLL